MWRRDARGRMKIDAFVQIIPGNSYLCALGLCSVMFRANWLRFGPLTKEDATDGGYYEPWVSYDANNWTNVPVHAASRD
jgi:hypothetical protein